MRRSQAVTALIRHGTVTGFTRHIREAPGPRRSRRAEPKGGGRYAQQKGSARTSGWAHRQMCVAGRPIHMQRLCGVRRCKSVLPVGEGRRRPGKGPGELFSRQRAEPRPGRAFAQRKHWVAVKAAAGFVRNRRAAPGPRGWRTDRSVWRGLAFMGDGGVGCDVAKAPSPWGRSGRCPAMPGVNTEPMSQKKSSVVLSFDKRIQKALDVARLQEVEALTTRSLYKTSKITIWSLVV